MNQPICITTKDVEQFCERIKSCEDSIKFMSDNFDELKKSLGKIEILLETQHKDLEAYRSDTKGLVANWVALFDEKIGEVPKGESVMSISRKSDEKINKVYWIFGFVLVGIEILSNLPALVWILKVKL